MRYLSQFNLKDGVINAEMVLQLLGSVRQEAVSGVPVDFHCDVTFLFISGSPSCVLELPLRSQAVDVL